MTYASVLSVFLCVSEVPGVVSRSCMTRIILFAQNRKISAKHPGRFLTFTLKIVEDVTVQPCVSGLDLKSHFFFPQETLPGDGGEDGSRGSKGCVGMTGGFALDVCIA